jgi:hypothetical protein
MSINKRIFLKDYLPEFLAFFALITGPTLNYFSPEIYESIKNYELLHIKVHGHHLTLYTFFKVFLMGGIFLITMGLHSFKDTIKGGELSGRSAILPLYTGVFWGLFAILFTAFMMKVTGYDEIIRLAFSNGATDIVFAYLVSILILGHCKATRYLRMSAIVDDILLILMLTILTALGIRGGELINYSYILFLLLPVLIITYKVKKKNIEYPLLYIFLIFAGSLIAFISNIEPGIGGVFVICSMYFASKHKEIYEQKAIKKVNKILEPLSDYIVIPGYIFLTTGITLTTPNDITYIMLVLLLSGKFIGSFISTIIGSKIHGIKIPITKIELMVVCLITGIAFTMGTYMLESFNGISLEIEESIKMSFVLSFPVVLFFLILVAKFLGIRRKKFVELKS